MNKKSARRHALQGLVAAGAAVAAVVGVLVAPALAAPGTVSETINVAPLVRSVTVTPAVVAQCSSTSPLTFPNGTCTSGAILVTNGMVPGHIDVNGADAVPSDNGTHWTLCGACVPGQDQYHELTQNTIAVAGTPPALSNTPACDGSFGGGVVSSCAAATSQAESEDIQLEGPSASTDGSSTFSSTVTWTAVP